MREMVVLKSLLISQPVCSIPKHQYLVIGTNIQKSISKICKNFPMLNLKVGCSLIKLIIFIKNLFLQFLSRHGDIISRVILHKDYLRQCGAYAFLLPRSNIMDGRV